MAGLDPAIQAVALRFWNFFPSFTLYHCALVDGRVKPGHDITGMSPMKKTPEIGRHLDLEEKAFADAFETGGAPLKSRLKPERESEIEAMARVTMAGERAKISLRVPKRDLTRLKSRALQEGIPYQSLINALIHRYVSE
jgi:predicted DNA binding CopG/RHH family protein